MTREDRVLVVEDNPSITIAIEERYSCDRAADGWDAIERLEQFDDAAILIDADVPHHSGFGVLTYLREEMGEELPNVIVMTSADKEEVNRRVGAHKTVVGTDES